jgi:hypothetical protein
MSVVDERERLISEISNISKIAKGQLKPLIQKLAANIAGSLDRPEVKNWAKLEGIENPETKDVIRIILRLKKKNEWAFSRTMIYDYIQPEYKDTQIEQSQENKPQRITDDFLLSEKWDELEERRKELLKGPAKDVKIKTKKDEIDLQDWNNPLSLELVLLAKKIHDEYDEKQKEIIKEIADRIRMVRDARFATTWAHYEGIVVAINASKSLTKAIDEEKYTLTRDEIDKNEKKCEECYCHGAPKKDCGECHCHRTVQEMTTKGLKWALKHNKRLGELDEHFKRIGNMDHEDLCPHIKALFSNPNMDKHLSFDDKLNMLSSHIEREQCIRCEMFKEEHPDFFKEGK